MKTLSQLESGECRYALNERDRENFWRDEYIFCAEKVAEGKSYCPEHHKLCSVPIKHDKYHTVQRYNVRKL